MSAVLVVDNDPDTWVLLRTILETEGHAVVEAPDGEAALDIIGPSSLVDLVVTDLMMPVLDGVALIERLQSEQATAAIPIVVVTGNSDGAQALQTSGRVDAVVRKPFDARSFAECIRAIASRPMRSVQV